MNFKLGMSSDTATSVEIHLQRFPPPELRHVAPWTEIDLSDYSTESEDIVMVPAAKPEVPEISLWLTVLIIVNISSIMVLNSMLGGLLVVCLPIISKDLKLDESLLLWPVSVTALSCGCTLLIFGSVSDVVGPRRIYIGGCFLLTGTTVACGLARTGIEFILFRATQGLALSLCLPAAVQLITGNIPTGARRNIAFASLGAGQPAGFALGLVLGGVFVQGIGWRYGYYIGASITFVVFLFSIFGLPGDRKTYRVNAFRRLCTEIDWVGCIVISIALGVFSYVLSVLASDAHNIVQPLPLVLLGFSGLLLPIFVFYVRVQDDKDKPTLFPFSLWQSFVFTALSVTIFLSWAVFQSLQIFITLYWQLVVRHSTTATSLQFLPMVISGAFVNFLSGHLVSRISAFYLILAAAMVTAVSPLLLAIIPVGSTYWTYGFWATALSPVAVDVLFTVSNLVITAAFDDEMHGVAGGVLNTVLNIGQSFGLSISAVISQTVTTRATYAGPSALMEGYRAVFWTCFGGTMLVVLIVLAGLRSVGKVGMKRD